MKTSKIRAAKASGIWYNTPATQRLTTTAIKTVPQGVEIIQRINFGIRGMQYLYVLFFSLVLLFGFILPPLIATISTFIPNDVFPLAFFWIPDDLKTLGAVLIESVFVIIFGGCLGVIVKRLEKETIILSKGSLTIGKRLFGLMIRKTPYTIAHIHNLRFQPIKGSKNVVLMFDYDSHNGLQTIRCCKRYNHGINPLEAQILMKALSDMMTFYCHSVEGIIFGALPMTVGDPYTTLQNPDVSELSFPFVHLKHIMIAPKSYDFYQVERFLTYAVNYLDQNILRETVDVHICGNQENDMRVPISKKK